MVNGKNRQSMPVFHSRTTGTLHQSVILPFKSSIHRGFSIAMFDYQRVRNCDWDNLDPRRFFLQGFSLQPMDSGDLGQAFSVWPGQNGQ